MRSFVAPAAVAIASILGSQGPVQATDWACSPWEAVQPTPDVLKVLAATYLRGQFWCFAEKGAVLASPDGVAWQPAGTTPETLLDVLWTGSQLIGVGSSQVLVSADGLRWDAKLDLGPVEPWWYPSLSSVAANGSTTVVVGTVATKGCTLCDWESGRLLRTSHAGAVWTSPQLPAVSDPAASFLSDIVWAKGAFVAVGSALLTSPDGDSWTGREDITGRSIAANEHVVVVSGDAGLFVSRDLSTWQHFDSPVLRGVLGELNGRIMLAGRCWTCPDREPSLWSSLDGTSWQRSTLDQPVLLQAFASNGPRLVAAGYGTAVSDDGMAWRTRHAQLATSFNDLDFVGTTTVAVGEQGELLTSTGGGPWQRVMWGGGVPLRHVIRGPGGLLVAGDGVILTSPDGATWARHDAPGRANVTALTTLGSGYVAGTDSGGLFTSVDGATWQPVSLAQIGWSPASVRRLAASSGAVVAAVTKASGGTALIASRGGGPWVTVLEAPGLDTLVAGGERFVATAREKVLASADGLTWQQVATAGYQPFDVVWVGGRFASSYRSSPDGVTWEPTEALPSEYLAATESHLWRLSESAGLLRSRCGTVATNVALPSLAHRSGAQGTTWRSDLEIHNPGPESVTVGLLDLGVALSLQPNESRRIDDVAAGIDTGSVFRPPALRVESWGGRVLAAARTYNDTPGGTLGQMIPPFPMTGPESTESELRLIQLSHSADRASGFRTNLGLFAGNQTVELWRSDHLLLATTTQTLGDWIFYADALRQPDVGNIPDAYYIIRSLQPGTRLHAYASVIDNRTGDPMLVTPATPIPPGEVAWVPGTGHTVGLNGSVWRTDLELHNPGSSGASCRVELFPWNTATTTPAVVEIAVPAGQSVRVTDIVGERFHREGGASLRLRPTGGALMANARSYSAGPAGSVGQLLPALLLNQAITPGSPRRLIMLRQSASRSSGYRSNVGLVSTTSIPTTVEVVLRDAAGRVLGTVVQPLRPFESLQLTEVLRRVTSAAVEDASAEIRTATPGSAVLAYGCLIDNRTNDPLLIAAQ